jgi:hypothetical protein
MICAARILEKFFLLAGQIMALAGIQKRERRDVILLQQSLFDFGECSIMEDA